MIFSHKYVIKLLLKYLNKYVSNKTLYIDVENLLQKSEQLISLALKFNLTTNVNIRDKIINHIEEIKELDSFFISKLLQMLCEIQSKEGNLI